MARTVQFSYQVNEKPRPAALDAMMQIASEQLGEKWIAVRISRYWYFYQKDRTNQTIKSTRSARRDFTAALSEGLDCTVISEIPI